MSGWVALNVELDDGEDEVDDTKELQIEEALKLYTNALKIHSQGPASFPQAREAYDALFKSDIFKYPESISDFKQAEPSNAFDETATDATVEFNVNDSTSSLFQTLYLAHKNRGRYLLDVLQESLKTEPDSTQNIQDASKKALGSFADALERDDTDLHLWRQSARLSGALESFRLARFCLESALVDDENRLESQSARMGIEEMFSEESLLATLKSLGDELSSSQVPVKKPKKALARYLKHHDDPFPYLPNLPGDLQSLSPYKGPLALSTSRREICPLSPTWESVGKAIVQALDEEENGDSAAAPSRSIRVILPHRDSEMTETVPSKETDITDVTENNAIIKVGIEDAEILAENSPQDVAPEKNAAGSPKASLEPAGEQSTGKPLTESLEISCATPNENQLADNDSTQQEDEPKSPIEVRKRSSASAANEEQPEGGRMKSRRTRARESNADGLVIPEEIAFDQEKFYSDRLEVYVHADDWLFNTFGSLISKVGIEATGSIESVREKVTTSIDSNETPKDSETRLFQDLRGMVKTWNDGKYRVMIQKDDVSALKDIRGSKSGLAVFLEHSRKTGRKPPSQEELPSGEALYRFIDTVNDGWLHPHDTSYEWIKCLLMPHFGEILLDWPVMKSAYESFLWPAHLKETVVNLLVREDEFIFAKFCESVEDLEHRMLSSTVPFEYHAADFYDLEMIQAIFELHLDLYATLTALGDDSNQDQQIPQRDRLSRWGILARSSLNHFFDLCPSSECKKNISLRHLWATVFQMNLIGEAEREHVLLCLQDLKNVLHTVGDPITCLVNNSVMSELSAAAIDQEVLKLKCMDFFGKVFNSEDENPVSLIEAIEPILEPSSVEYPEESEAQDAPSHSSEMASFLDRGDATLRLFLWRRLHDAYQTIDYPPKVVCCYLRSIETVMAELENAKHIEESSENRQVTLLGWLKSLDAIMAKAIPLVLQIGEKAYECVDMDHLQASMSAISRLVRLLHSFILYEDSVRVGQTSERSDLRSYHAKSLSNFKERMRELYVNCWIMLYTLLVEAISQNKDVFNEPIEDRIHVLRSLHHALGIRLMCKYSNKRFLKLIKSELSDLESKGDYDTDVCQVLFDLHGIKFSSTDWISDHGCPPENLDQPTAIAMIDFVIKQARNMNIKDLSKSELKTAIEKMQKAIGAAKISSASPQFSFNRRLYMAYIKTPINPSNIGRSIQGAGAELPTVPVPGEKAKIASTGWYFLLGHATLTKFRSQKRTSPGSTSELDDAISFFRQDIDQGTARWETWYRLAQVYDTKVDEDITWAADKINNNRPELATLQRYAIHCYSMAVTTAVKTIAPTAENREVLSDLYTDFGIRLYCSSREPLSMGAFKLEDFPRHFSHGDSQAMYKAQPFKEMPLYSVWGLASILLKKAIAIGGNKQKKWMTHYFLGKCLWKMLNCDDSMRTSSKIVEPHHVLDAFHGAILALPQRRDSRSEPIFEPHFKLLTAVQKLVARGKMTPTDASKALLASPWAGKVAVPNDSEGWTPYILEVIKTFKGADKANWHHRMSARAAHIIYDDDKNPTTAAAARHEMSQIFTKTLTIQVWRPEFERPGRHFVYTTRYVYFFAGLLDQLDDRASLDQLLRRVKKKPGDFLDHTKLWGDLCLIFAKVTRRAGNIQEGHEENVFKPISWDEFSSNTARLETLTQLSPESLPILELLRDSVEMRKCNNNLMKVTMFEDLIADLYARVYELNMPLIIEQANEENKEKMKVDHLLMAGDINTEPSTPATPAPTSDTPAPRGRTKGIARRDIQKRADNIINLKLPRTAIGKSSVTADTEPASGRRDSTSAAASGHAPALNGTSNPSSTANGSNEQPKINVITGLESDDGDEKPLTNTSLHNVFKNESAVETEDDEIGSGEEAADDGDGEDEGEGANYDEAEGDGEDPNATEIENDDYDMPDADDGATVDETIIDETILDEIILDETILDETVIDETIIEETDIDEEKAQDQLVGNE